jgi:hypothetical protein
MQITYNPVWIVGTGAMGRGIAQIAAQAPRALFWLSIFQPCRAAESGGSHRRPPDQRYRPSPWLRRRGAIGLRLKHEES